MRNNILITEEVEHEVINNILSEAFHPSAEKVRIIKDYLDKNFSRAQMDDIDDNGYPKKVNAFNMLNNNGQVLKVMQPSEFLRLLDDKFHNMISDKEDRRKFLKQVIIDWFDNKISNNGILSVNTL